MTEISDVGIAERQKLGKHGKNNSIKQFGIQHFLFQYTCIAEKDIWKGGRGLYREPFYATILTLFSHFFFAILISLHFTMLLTLFYHL